VPAGLDVQHPDDLGAGHRDDRPGHGAGEQRGALLDVNRRLGREPVALARHSREQLRRRPRVGCPGRPDRELRHRPTLAFRAGGQPRRRGGQDRGRVLSGS
jgi:hypothetical protein